MANNTDTRFDHYPETDMFKAIDTISIPHPFCITSKHVKHAADNFGGILSEEAMQDYDKRNPNKKSCGIGGCDLKYAKHETALVILIKTGQDLKTLEKELKEYLLECNPICIKDGYAGYAFHRESEDINPTIH